ncbi:MAG: hypothetical protein DMG03_22340, partial [Acidobacteria bacterium]
MALLSKRSRRVKSPNDKSTKTAPMAVRERGATAVCASVFLVALAIRLIAARELWQLPLVRTPKLDSAEYLSWARRLAAGDFSWPVVSQHGPGYPLFLAAWLAIGSGSPPFAIAVQAVVGALTATLVAAIARDSFGDGAALAAGLVYVLYAPAIYVDVALLSEGLLLFLLTLALLLLGRAENLWRGPFRPVSAALKGPPRFVIASAGVALGCAILVRPTAVVVASACAMWLLVQRSRNAAAILVVTCAVVIAPAVAKNWSVSRTLSLQGYGGLNVYIGNSPQQSGRPIRRRRIATISGRRCQKSAGSRSLICDSSLRNSCGSSRPKRSATAIASIFSRTVVGAVSIAIARLKASRYKDEGTGTVARAFQASGSFETIGLLLSYAVAVAISNVFLVVGFRYRMPLVPALAVAAGVAVASVADALRTHNTRALAIQAAAGVAAIAFSRALNDPRNRNLAEEWAFTGSALITEHDLGGAEAAYRRALTLDPKSGFAWDGLGLALYDGG